MSETVQVSDAADLICNLKAAVTSLECQYKMNLLEKQALRKEKKPRSPPMFMMIPIEQKRNGDESSICEDRKTRNHAKNHREDYSDEYPDSIASSDCPRTKDRRHDECDYNNGPKIRGGVLHTRCGCIHRDGLQDSCPLTECQDHPECMTKPWPVCAPAKYFQLHFPDNYPKARAVSTTFGPCDD